MRFLGLSTGIIFGSYLQIMSLQMATQCTQFDIIALTFDDRSIEYTPKMLNQHSEFAKRAYDEGHQTASHRYDHKCLYGLSPNGIKVEIKKSETILEKITGKQVGFNLDTKGYEERKNDPNNITKNYIDASGKEGIIIVYFITLETVGLFKGKGFEFITSDEWTKKVPLIELDLPKENKVLKQEVEYQIQEIKPFLRKEIVLALQKLKSSLSKLAIPEPNTSFNEESKVAISEVEGPLTEELDGQGMNLGDTNEKKEALRILI
ncbi:hypothetical protein K502DRAFT_348463 [Neoconidiobolus thromboides FSU 785]|nr:hypothetical protein K502DRAFT_348463 [Neoconidiobolus thromboides FSU 785]